MHAVKLNIGAGKRIHPGWINADLHAGPGIDVVFDVCQPWPFKESSVHFVSGNHMLEHLHDPQALFKAAHHALVPGGRMSLTVPYGVSAEAMADPTHVRPWTPLSFCFLQPGWDEETLNPQHDGWTAYFGIEMCLRQVNERLRFLMRKPLRYLGIRLLPFLWDAYTSLTVGLVALKSVEAAAAWRREHWPQQALVHDFMPRHLYEGRELRPGEQKEFIFFAERSG